jgi:hypothetical protein
VLDLLEVCVGSPAGRPARPARGAARSKAVGAVCGPTCRVMRRVPSLRIEGLVLEGLDLERERPAVVAGGAIPFRGLVLGGVAESPAFR